MCGGGGADTTRQRSKTTSEAIGQPVMEGVVNRAEGVSQLPYNPITQGVAGMTPEQIQAMNSVGGAYSMVSPYLQSAAQHFENASQPLSQADIDVYRNPYESAVTKNLQEIFGQQQRDTTGKLTGAAGGIGADRISVGQSELARQQGLAAGQTYASIYQNAAQMAQNQQGIEQASAYGLGNLSQAEINSILAAAQSQFGMGSVGQQTNQMGLNATYNQQMAQEAFPYQQAQWYAGLALPAASGYGNTSKGVQSVNPPNPNPVSQWAGLGLTALGAFAKDGGRIEGYAQGGSPYNASEGMFGGAGSYIPSVPMPGMQQASAPPLEFMSPPAQSGGVGGKGSNVQAGASAGAGGRNIYDWLTGGSPASADNMGWSTTVSPTGAGWGNILGNMFSARGGGIEHHEPYQILTGIARGKGGKVEGYAYGGSPLLTDEDPYELSPFTPAGSVKGLDRLIAPEKAYPERFEGDASPIPEAFKPITTRGETAMVKSPFPVSSVAKTTPGVASPGMDVSKTSTPLPAGPAETSPFDIAPEKKDYSVYTPESGYSQGDADAPDYTAKSGYYKGQSVPPPPPYFPAGGTPDIGKKIAVNGEDPQQVSFADEETGPRGPLSGQPGEDSDYSSGPSNSPGSGRWSQAYGNVPPYDKPKLFGKEMSNMNLALMAAGLGMMGGESPHFGVNVGQGGLKGIAALQEFQKMDADRQAKALQNMLEAGRLDLGEQQQAFSRYDKMIGNERDLAVYYDGIGDTEKANEHQARADELTKQYYGNSAQAPTDLSEAEAPSATAEAAPTTEYGAIEPPRADVTHLSKDARAMYKARGIKTLEEADKAYDASQQQSILLAQTRHALSEMPKDGLLTAGPGAQFRNEFARFVNTAYSIAGLPTPIDPTTIGSIEELKKLTTRMGFELARTLGTREAMQVIQQAVAAVPGAENTPMGARRIMAGIQAGFIRDREWYEYLDGYAAKNGGDIRGAKAAFNKARPVSHYIKMSGEIVAAQTLVADGKMSQEEATAHLEEMGINPDDVF